MAFIKCSSSGGTAKTTQIYVLKNNAITQLIGAASTVTSLTGTYSDCDLIFATAFASTSSSIRFTITDT